MITEYVEAAMRRAQSEMIEDEPTFFGNIPGLDGVWATGESIDACREELREVLEDWILIRVSLHLDVPVVDGIEISVRSVA